MLEERGNDRRWTDGWLGGLAASRELDFEKDCWLVYLSSVDSAQSRRGYILTHGHSYPFPADIPRLPKIFFSSLIFIILNLNRNKKNIFFWNLFHHFHRLSSSGLLVTTTTTAIVPFSPFLE